MGFCAEGNKRENKRQLKALAIFNFGAAARGVVDLK